MKNDNSWIQTYTGKKFYPLNPNIKDICIEDICHALSNLCRFTGHCSDFYSVAQHSVYVSYNCKPENALAGLLHDGSEFSLTDVASPIKNHPDFAFYKNFEHKLQLMIYKKFCNLDEEPIDVKNADIRMLCTEARDLMSPNHPEWELPGKPYDDFKIIPLSPKQSEALFMKRFFELTNSPEDFVKKYNEFITLEFGGVDPLDV